MRKWNIIEHFVTSSPTSIGIRMAMDMVLTARKLPIGLLPNRIETKYQSGVAAGTRWGVSKVGISEAFASLILTEAFGYKIAFQHRFCQSSERFRVLSLPNPQTLRLWHTFLRSGTVADMYVIFKGHWPSPFCLWTYQFRQSKWYELGDLSSSIVRKTSRRLNVYWWRR